MERTVIICVAARLMVHAAQGINPLNDATASTLHVSASQAGSSTRPLGPFIASLPKAELHVHVEGTLEAEMMLALGKRNNISLPYADVEAARAARASYTSLEDFLHEYNLGMSVLHTEQDYYELADAYLNRAAQNNVRVVELFFDAQAHIARGVPTERFMAGLSRAVSEAPSRHGVHAALINCFVRDLGPKSAGKALKQLKANKQLKAYKQLIGVGLDSAEQGYPPSLFQDVFSDAGNLGLHRVAHAGEEGGPDYVWQAIRLLNVQRVDHGIRSIEDSLLVAYLERLQLPITLCPISNLKLQVYAGSLEERLRQLLSTQIAVTLNSDDPAYFNAYLNDNYEYMQQVAGLSAAELAHLSGNSFKAAFISQELKDTYLREVQAALAAWQDGQQES